jgi:hypothetical protein
LKFDRNSIDDNSAPHTKVEKKKNKGSKRRRRRKKKKQKPKRSKANNKNQKPRGDKVLIDSITWPSSSSSSFIDFISTLIAKNDIFLGLLIKF